MKIEKNIILKEEDLIIIKKSIADSKLILIAKRIIYFYNNLIYLIFLENKKIYIKYKYI
jgi:hypothetical protein